MVYQPINISEEKLVDNAEFGRKNGRYSAVTLIYIPGALAMGAPKYRQFGVSKTDGMSVSEGRT